jgi:gamma-glutamylcyclotransferase (GGCT)/AIG2-like uncharacterized protein YtfP
MMKVFSYGTLWQENIQIREFNRIFSVDPDIDYVSGFDLINIKMYNSYYKVAISASKSSIISGAIINVPEDSIWMLDEYEGNEYTRIEIDTLCGNKCQMYVKRIG